VARRQPDGSWLYVFGHGSRPTIARRALHPRARPAGSLVHRSRGTHSIASRRSWRWDLIAGAADSAAVQTVSAGGRAW